MTTTPRTHAAIIAAGGRWTYELKEEMQAMERELAAANERIKRLEEAGDAIESDKRALLAILNDLGASGTIGNASTKQWREAKEAKP